MAEAIYNARAKAAGFEPAESAGTNVAREGEGASENAKRAVLPYGGDLSTHRARQATPELIRRFDRVYYMTELNRVLLEVICPDCADRYFPLAPEGIPDPYGGNFDEYSFCCARIESALQKITGR